MAIGLGLASAWSRGRGGPAIGRFQRPNLHSISRKKQSKIEQVSWFHILLPEICDAGMMAWVQLGSHGHEQHQPVRNMIE